MAGNEVLRELLVRLGVKVDPKSKKEQREFDQSIQRIKDGMEELGNVALQTGKLVAGALVAGAVAMGALAVSTGQQAEDIERQALGLNLTRKEYQELLHVFESFGAQAEDMADAFLQINDRAVDAVNGSAEAAEQFRLVGISAEQLRGLDPGEIFTLLAKHVSSATDKQRAMAAVSKLLGEEMGRKMAPALMAGADAISQLRQEAHELGVVMTDEQLAAAEAASRSWRRLMFGLKGLRNELGVALAPMVERFTKRILDWIRANRELLSQQIETWVRRIERALIAANIAAEAVGGWDVVFMNVATGVGLTTLLLNLDKAKALLLGIQTLFTAIKVSFVAVAVAMGIPVGVLVALVVALIAQLILWGLVIDDLMTHWRGGDSVLGRFVQTLETMFPVLKDVKELFRALFDLFLVGVTNAKLVGTALLEGLAPGFAVLNALLGPVLATLDGIWKRLNDIAGAPIRGLTDFIRGITGEASAAGVVHADQVRTAVSGAVEGQVERAAQVGQSLDQSVRTTTMYANFQNTTPSDVMHTLEGVFRKAQASVLGGAR